MFHDWFHAELLKRKHIQVALKVYRDRLVQLNLKQEDNPHFLIKHLVEAERRSTKWYLFRQFFAHPIKFLRGLIKHGNPLRFLRDPIEAVSTLGNLLEIYGLLALESRSPSSVCIQKLLGFSRFGECGNFKETLERVKQRDLERIARARSDNNSRFLLDLDALMTQSPGLLDKLLALSYQEVQDVSLLLKEITGSQYPSELGHVIVEIFRDGSLFSDWPKKLKNELVGCFGRAATRVYMSSAVNPNTLFKIMECLLLAGHPECRTQFKDRFLINSYSETIPQIFDKIFPNKNIKKIFEDKLVHETLLALMAKNFSLLQREDSLFEVANFLGEIHRSFYFQDCAEKMSDLIMIHCEGLTADTNFTIHMNKINTARFARALHRLPDHVLTIENLRELIAIAVRDEPLGGGEDPLNVRVLQLLEQNPRRQPLAPQVRPAPPALVRQVRPALPVVARAPQSTFNTAQSTHNVFAEKSISISAGALKARYQNKFTSAGLERVHQEIQEYINAYSNEGSKTTAQACFSKIKNQSYSREVPGTGECVTTKDLIGYLWLAFHDHEVFTLSLGADEEVLPVDKKAELRRAKCVEVTEVSKQYFIENGFIEIARGYNLDASGNDKGGEDQQICIAGTFNKLINAAQHLQGIHPDINVTILSTEMMSAKLQAMVKARAFDCLGTVRNQLGLDQAAFINLLQTLTKDGGISDELWERMNPTEIEDELLAEFGELIRCDAAFTGGIKDKAAFLDMVASGKDYEISQSIRKHLLLILLEQRIQERLAGSCVDKDELIANITLACEECEMAYPWAFNSGAWKVEFKKFQESKPNEPLDLVGFQATCFRREMDLITTSEKQALLEKLLPKTDSGATEGASSSCAFRTSESETTSREIRKMRAAVAAAAAEKRRSQNESGPAV